MWKKQWGEAWCASNACNSRDVAILVQNSVSLQLNSSYSDPNGRFDIISVTVNKMPLLLVNLYALNSDDPDFFLEVFAKINQFDYTSIIFWGDFNAVLGPLNYHGSKDKHSNVKVVVKAT